MGRSFRKFIADRSGATAIEYGLIAALVAVAIVAGVGTFGGTMNDMFIYVSDTVEGAWGTGG